MLHLNDAMPLDTFRQLAGTYRRQWNVRLCAVDAAGERVHARKWWRSGADTEAERQVLRFAVDEAMRWGEPTVTCGPTDRLVWAAPVLVNQQTLGAVIAGVTQAELFPADADVPALDLRSACADLRQLLEDANLTNAALLASRRLEYRREQERHAALAALKADPAGQLRQLYLQDEPQLVAAVRRGDRSAARLVLNRILMVILGRSDLRFDLVRSFLMELVATVSRTAVEAGGDAEQLLGENFNRLGQLGSMSSLEDVAPWLHETLERTMDLIARHRQTTDGILINNAISYMRLHLADDIGRDDVASVACLSPSHFSRLFKAHVGRSFTESLARMRIDAACELLRTTDLPIAAIGERVGIADPSYFVKVFRRYADLTPAAYRRRPDTPAE